MDRQRPENPGHTQVVRLRRWCVILWGFVLDVNGRFRSHLAGGRQDVRMPPLEEMSCLAVHTGAVF